MRNAIDPAKVKIIGIHELPEKAIVLYGDGSGGSIVKRWCDTYFTYACDEEQTKCTIEDIQDAGHVFFIELPDDFEIFGE